MDSLEEFIESVVYRQTVGGVNLSFHTKASLEFLAFLPRGRNRLLVGDRKGLKLLELDPAGQLVFLREVYTKNREEENYVFRKVLAGEDGGRVVALLVEPFYTLKPEVRPHRLVVLDEAKEEVKTFARQMLEAYIDPKGDRILILGKRTFLYKVDDLLAGSGEELILRRSITSACFSASGETVAMATSIRSLVIIWRHRPALGRWEESAVVSVNFFTKPTRVTKLILFRGSLFMLGVNARKRLLLHAYVAEAEEARERETSRAKRLPDEMRQVNQKAMEGWHHAKLLLDECFGLALYGSSVVVVSKTKTYHLDARSLESTNAQTRSLKGEVEFLFGSSGALTASKCLSFYRARTKTKTKLQLQLQSPELIRTYGMPVSNPKLVSWGLSPDERWLVTSDPLKGIFAWDLEYLREHDSPDFQEKRVLRPILPAQRLPAPLPAQRLPAPLPAPLPAQRLLAPLPAPMLPVLGLPDRAPPR